MPRGVLVRIWWRRFMLRPKIIAAMGVLVACTVVFFMWPAGLDSKPGGLKAWGIAGLGAVLVLPMIFYSALSKAAARNSQWTDPKTVEFGPSGLIVTGPNYRSELPWTYFKGFSEDQKHFYLHLGNTGVDSVIPKSAFSQELQETFRKRAQVVNAR